MEQPTINISDYVSMLKRRRVSIFVIGLIVFAIGASIATLWPPTYRSSATILIKEQDIPADLVRSTVTSFASQRIQSISQRVMARPNLLEIIAKYSLYEAEMKRLTKEVVVARMREDIDLDMISASVKDPRSGRATTAVIAFKLSFLSENSRQAQQVTNELMSLYLKENLKARSAQASETLAFFDSEMSRLDTQYEELEQRLVKFKSEHADELPGSAELHLLSMRTAQDKLEQLAVEMRTFKAVYESMEDELAKTDPHGSTDQSGQFDPYTRLRAMRAEYLRLTARYSQSHPDVIQTKRLIEGLEQEVGETNGTDGLAEQLNLLRSQHSALKDKYSDVHPDVVKLQKQIMAIETELLTSSPTDIVNNVAADKDSTPAPNNPVYLTLQSRITSASIRWNELQTQGQLLQNKLAKHEKYVASAPRLEMEYSEISSKLSAITKRRQDIQEKQVEAKVALDLEKQSKGERFEIIEPPVQPAEPISPNRPAIYIVSLLLALASGFGYAILIETLSNKIRGNASIIKAVGTAPLATIPYLQIDSEVRRRKRGVALKIGAVVTAIVLSISAVHYFWTPLDVLWYKAIRKADIVINT